eukprot:m.33570 g.33570  ORF g.33570 m.33570 type:complete len:57 (-) comp43111_c0_seq1:61-231(-)
MFQLTVRTSVRAYAAATAAEDPIKRLFIEKLKDYQKKKPKNDDNKRTVAELAVRLK